MPTRWETFPIELSGGLVSNLSRLQQGIKMPGSARLMQNFEPSTEGGYRRINGYTKFDDENVPSFGGSLVQGSGQSGTTLIVANLHAEPASGITFTISGVTGTYTVSSASYSSTNKEATLTITPTLASSPADKAAVTFSNGTSRIEGVFYDQNADAVYALRDGVLWESGGSGWTKLSTPSYGSVLVAGGAQSGTTLNVDAIASDDYTPLPGDTFTISGVEKVYTVLSKPTVTSGAAALSIYPALASSPADNAPITFLNTSHSGGSKARFETFNFDGTFKTVMVDGSNYPVVITAAGAYSSIQGSADVVGASIVKEFKDHLFFAKADLVTFTVPFDETDFSPGSGAGSFRLNGRCTGLAIFRSTLICFSEDEIKNLTGDSSTDFTLTTITDKLGCLEPDSIQEIGGDILYLGPDGVRYLSGTDAFGDFALQLASRQITDEFNRYIDNSKQYCSVVIRKKNQYRIFRYEAGSDENALGYVGMQKSDQTGQGFEWGSLLGINAYVASSTYDNETEFVVFANDSGFVYRMDVSNDFDGTAIVGRYYTPFMSINDPNIRKTLFKVTTYYDPEGAIFGRCTPRYDFNQPGRIQPSSIDFIGGGVFTFYGSGVYGTSTYGGLPDTFQKKNTTGSFFTVSLEYEFGADGDIMAPFVLDTVLLEYSTNDRK